MNDEAAHPRPDSVPDDRITAGTPADADPPPAAAGPDRTTPGTDAGWAGQPADREGAARWQYGGGRPPPPGVGAFTSRYGLVRPRQGRYLAGVCAAVGRATNTDPILWRVLLAVLGFFGGIGILVYVAAWLIIPAEGDSASPVESMLGRGKSSMSPVTVLVLGVLVAVMFGYIVTDGFRAVLLGVAILIGGALLLNRDANRTTGPVPGDATMPPQPWDTGAPQTGPVPAGCAATAGTAYESAGYGSVPPSGVSSGPGYGTPSTPGYGATSATGSPVAGQFASGEVPGPVHPAWYQTPAGSAGPPYGSGQPVSEPASAGIGPSVSGPPGTVQAGTMQAGTMQAGDWPAATGGARPGSVPTTTVPAWSGGSPPPAAASLAAPPPPPGGYRPPFAPRGPYAGPYPPGGYPPGPVPPPGSTKRPKPPKPSRERSPLGAATFSLIFLAIGVVAILDLANAVRIGPSAYFAATLLTIAAGLLVGTWFGRARWLIALGLAGAAALGISTLAESYERVGSESGSISWAPLSVDTMADRYETRFGDGTLDLREVDFTGDQETEVMVRVDFGELRVLVPAEVDTTVVMEVKAGEARAFGTQWSVFEGPAREVTDLGPDGPGGGTLLVMLYVNAGDAEVSR